MPLLTSFSLSMALWISAFSEASILSPSSPRVFSVW
ncbi:secreted protein [gut metagenome]|uniref:Secreted protein n=1 Tax=gut metagenome TaxID=749906 RepID=J9C498_9ZZZZ